MLTELNVLLRIQKAMIRARHRPRYERFDEALKEFGIDVTLQGAAKPSAGTIYTCTHWFGIVDGVAILSHLTRFVPNLMVLSNTLASQFPLVGEISIHTHSISSGRSNAEAARQARVHLAKGGNLLVFPAGKIGDWSGVRPVDFPWRRGFARWMELDRSLRAIPCQVNVVWSPTQVQASAKLHQDMRRRGGERFDASAPLRHYSRIENARVEVWIGSACKFQSTVEETTQKLRRLAHARTDFVD